MFKQPDYQNDGNEKKMLEVKLQWLNTKMVGKCTKASLQVQLQ
jgi:hypothetical protein